MHLWARFARWRHGMICMWRGGLAVTMWDLDRRIILLACTCGREFYRADREAR
jgi:hypothetical protein